MANLVTYQKTEVYRYLITVQKYLIGDLEKFKKLCIDAEQEEQNQINSGNSTTSSSSAIATTKYPYSYEFIIGKTVISRSTIPHTITLFSTIDTLGFLNRSGQDISNTTKNFQTFFSYPQKSLDSNELDVLIKVYRHGLTHSYLPKLNMEISCHSTNPSNRMFFKNSFGDLALNVNHLMSVVTTRLDEIITNSSLFVNMEIQYNFLITDYENRCRNDIDILKSRI